MGVVLRTRMKETRSKVVMSCSWFPFGVRSGKLILFTISSHTHTHIGPIGKGIVLIRLFTLLSRILTMQSIHLIDSYCYISLVSRTRSGCTSKRSDTPKLAIWWLAIKRSFVHWDALPSHPQIIGMCSGGVFFVIARHPDSRYFEGTSTQRSKTVRSDRSSLCYYQLLSTYHEIDCLISTIINISWNRLFDINYYQHIMK